MDAQNRRLVLYWLHNSMKRKRTFYRQFRTLILNEYHRYQREITALLTNNRNIARRYWYTDYNQNWFECLWELRRSQFADEFFHREFRMTSNTFLYVMDLMTPSMSKQNTVFREAIAIQKRVAIAIWRVATGNSYRTISRVFGVSRSSISNILIECCTALCIIAPQFIKFPSNEIETATMIDLFRLTTNGVIPQVVGCIDSTHCKITSPDNNSKVDYFNRKQVYSVNTQAVVGERYRFIDVATGFPGSTHDSRVLRSTNLYASAERGEILNTPLKEVNGHSMKPVLIGDGAYRPVRWILKPYTRHNNLTRAQRHFNSHVCKARALVERAFGILKVRWRCLYKMMEQNIENVPSIIIACCVLHNICQERNERLRDEDLQLLEQIIVAERAVRQQQQRQQRRNICNNSDQQRFILTQYVQNINV